MTEQGFYAKRDLQSRRTSHNKGAEQHCLVQISLVLQGSFGIDHWVNEKGERRLPFFVDLIYYIIHVSFVLECVFPFPKLENVLSFD